jgi:hypothetical protein
MANDEEEESEEISIEESEKEKANKKEKKSELEEYLEGAEESDSGSSLKPIEIPDTTLKPIKTQPQKQVEDETIENLEEGVGGGIVSKKDSTKQEIRYLPQERHYEYIPSQQSRKTVGSVEGPKITTPLFRGRQNINFQDETKRINIQSGNQREYEFDPNFEIFETSFNEKEELPFADDRKYKEKF